MTEKATAATAPKGAKQPQDRKPKDDKPKVDKVDITVGEGDDKRTIPASRVAIRGVVVTVPHEALDDFEVLDDMRALQDEEDASRMPALLRRLIGDDYKRVLNALRDPSTGRVKVEDGTKFVWDLIGALGQGNS